MSPRFGKPGLKHVNVYQEIDPSKEKDYRFFGKAFKQIFGFLDPYKRRFYGTIVLSVIQALVFLILPALAGLALDVLEDIITGKEVEFGVSVSLMTGSQKVETARAAFLGLIGVVLMMLGAVISLAIIMYVRIWENNKIGNNIIFDLRRALFQSMQEQSYSFYDNNQVGDLVARSTSDVNLLKNVLSSELAFFLRNVLQFILALVVMLFLNIQLTLYSLFIMPALFFTMYFYRKRMHPLFLSSRKSYGQLASTVEENVNGMRVVRAFGQEKLEKKKFKERNDDYLDKSLKIAKLQSWFDPVINILNGAGLIFVIFIGGSLVVKGVMSIGDIFAFMLLLQFSLQPLRSIGVFIGKLSQINPASERIVEVLNSRSEIKQDPNAVDHDIVGTVQFKNASFRYPGTKKLVLKNVEFIVEPGETLAILGATGSGKSSIIQLISRLYDVPDGDGAVFIDGINIKTMDKQYLRSQIAIIAQETFLFSRSIKENIALARDEDEVTMDEIIECAKLASIHEFINSLPEKYDTVVGERGVTLSGGQKQRVSIARALMSKPRILILDDATSSVDVDTEYEIQKSFKNLFAGKKSTTFIISQRLSTIRMADKILVLEDGQIEELGTHDELLSKEDGIYKNIYSTLEEDAFIK
ncbi:ATP-binding cassette domain-containing protein [Candidatus Bathyarchaeota archaeon]|nr:ATP-binding cassette domain-containing protein [Candidatus Bathyarchaeota archaeon]